MSTPWGALFVLRDRNWNIMGVIVKYWNLYFNSLAFG